MMMMDLLRRYRYVYCVAVLSFAAAVAFNYTDVLIGLGSDDETSLQEA
jgi:hypothetical protein